MQMYRLTQMYAIQFEWYLFVMICTLNLDFMRLMFRLREMMEAAPQVKVEDETVEAAPQVEVEQGDTNVEAEEGN